MPFHDVMNLKSMNMNYVTNDKDLDVAQLPSPIINQ